MTRRSHQIELDPVFGVFEAVEDPRPRIEEPPAVRLVAVDDCYLWAPAGLETQLDEFYVRLLGFEREEDEENEAGLELVYRAENFRLRIEILERPIEREDLRALGVVVPSLRALRREMNEAEINFAFQRGFAPGMDHLLVRDPAGNSVTVGESRITI
jgi:hypothetical protein